MSGSWEVEAEMVKLGVTCLRQLLALTAVLYTPATTAPSSPSLPSPSPPSLHHCPDAPVTLNFLVQGVADLGASLYNDS